MILAALFACALASGSDAPDARFVESRIDCAGEVVGYECPDIDQDGRGDLALVVTEPQGRTLLAYLQTPERSFKSEPDRRWVLPPDVIAYRFFPLSAAADSPGLELLLFTRAGVFAASTAPLGLKGNLTKVLDVAIFPDVPAQKAVPRWSWVSDLDGDGVDELLVPQEGRLSVFEPSRDEATGAPRFASRGSLELRRHVDDGGDDDDDDGRGIRIGTSDDGKRRAGGPRDWFTGAPSTIPTFQTDPVLRRADAFDAPALIDWDGDGRKDALGAVGGSIEVTRLDADGTFAAASPERVALPESAGTWSGLRILDVGGDHRAEVLLVDQVGDGLEKDHIATLLGRAPDGKLATEPLARVKISAAGAEFDFADVDGDGLPDLIAKAVILPSALQAVADVWVEGRLFVFRGQADGSVSRKPDLRFERRLRPENLARIRESLVFELSGDFDGDGAKDLVLIRADGVLQIFPMKKSGDGLSFASDPSTSVRPNRPVRSARAESLSSDRVSDLVLRHENGLTVFVSIAGSEGR